jgi:SAM-dependent methyltransferase
VKPASWAHLVCPVHQEPLHDDGESLVCSHGETFPIRDRVPRFVGSSDYAGAFGRQWNRFRLTQLDSHSGLSASHDRLRRILGEELWAGLAGNTVLEAGCGAGRFTEVLLEGGARVASLDLSTAVEANASNFPPSERHTVAQADILRMPIGPASFDIVLAIGVIQHTPSPGETIRELFTRVKPGGWLVFDHYTWSPSRLGLSVLYRLRYRRMDPAESMRRIERLVDRLLPLHRKVADSHTLSFLLGRVSPVLSYYSVFPQLSAAQQREWALLDTYDSLTDAYKHLRSRRAIRSALERLGAENIACWRGGNGVEARAMKARARH